MSSNDRDQRLKNTPNLGKDNPPPKVADDARQDREAQDRPVVENRTMTDDERLEIFRSTSFQHTLPEVAPIPGYHLCWLTSNNPRDSIMMRVRWGYEPVKPHEVPGFQDAVITTGQHAGCVGVNEMILFKIPLRLYERYMQEAHHAGPLREEEKLRAVLEVIAQQAREKGADVEVGDGSATLGKGPRRAMFEEVTQ